MKTNLIFKRVHDGNIEMVMIPVEIPQLNKGEGWTLASCCDTFTKFEAPTETIVVTGKPLEMLEEASDGKSNDATPTNEQISINNIIPAGGKYESTTPGSARLVRYKDKIRITYRKGKTTYNRNDPNSVCIDDYLKQEFFNAVKKHYGSDPGVWQIVSTDSSYAYWNSLIDKIYEQGRVEYNRIPVSYQA